MDVAAALDRMTIRTQRTVWGMNIRALWRVARNWPRLHGRAERTILHIAFPDPEGAFAELGRIHWNEMSDGRRADVGCIQIFAGQAGPASEPWDAMASLLHELAHAATPSRIGHCRRWRQEVRYLVAWLGLPVTRELAEARTQYAIDRALYAICKGHITMIDTRRSRR
jgi:hypothetical protein